MPGAAAAPRSTPVRVRLGLAARDALGAPAEAPLAPLPDDEDVDEPEIPEYLIAEQQPRCGRGGGGGGGRPRRPLRLPVGDRTRALRARWGRGRHQPLPRCQRPGRPRRRAATSGAWCGDRDRSAVRRPRARARTPTSRGATCRPSSRPCSGRRSPRSRPRAGAPNGTGPAAGRCRAASDVPRADGPGTAEGAGTGGVAAVGTGEAATGTSDPVARHPQAGDEPRRLGRRSRRRPRWAEVAAAPRRPSGRGGRPAAAPRRPPKPRGRRRCPAPEGAAPTGAVGGRHTRGGRAGAKRRATRKPAAARATAEPGSGSGPRPDAAAGAEAPVAPKRRTTRKAAAADPGLTIEVDGLRTRGPAGCGRPPSPR